MNTQSETTDPVEPAHPGGPNTPKSTEPAKPDRGSSLERILARIGDERTRHYIQSDQSIYGLFAMAIAGELDAMWDVVAKSGGSPPTEVQATVSPAATRPEVAPALPAKAAAITDAEASALRAFLSERFGMPGQQGNRLSTDVMMIMAAMAERLTAMESLVAISLNRLDSAFAGDEAMAQNLDHQNAIAHLISFIQTRTQIHTASSRVPRATKQVSGR